MQINRTQIDVDMHPAFSDELARGDALADAMPAVPFKELLQLAGAEVLRIETLARSILADIDNAYIPGYQMTAAAAKIEHLKTLLNEFNGLLRNSGLGALPIIEKTDQPTIVDDAELAAKLDETVKTLYKQINNRQANAQAFSDLLSNSDTSLRLGGM